MGSSFLCRYKCSTQMCKYLASWLMDHMVKLLSFVRNCRNRYGLTVSFQDLNDIMMFLACMVSDVKSGVIIFFVFLYVIYHFFLDAWNISFLSLKDKMNLIKICFCDFCSIYPSWYLLLFLDHIYRFNKMWNFSGL